MAVSQDLYKLEAPEGGWGFIICIGMALPFISGLACMPSFGLVFDDFLKSLGEKSSATALITSAFFSAMSFAGLFTNTLFKKYSCRTVGLMGGILYFIGSILQIFVQTTWQLLVAFSLFQGAAFGLIVPAAYTTFNSYFVRRRVMMMSFAQTLIGIGTMLYPLVMQKLLDMYGFRGCLAVLAAFNSHAIFGMLVMQPVEWHMKKVKVDELELDEITKINNEKEKNLLNGHNDDANHLDPLLQNNETAITAVDKVIKSENNSNRNSLRGSNEILKNVKQSDDEIRDRASSIASLGNWTGAVVVSDTSERDKGPIVKWQVLVDFLDLTLLKDPIYVNIVLGISFALYSDVAFFTFQPLYLFKLGYSPGDTSKIIAIGAAADLSSRVFLAFSSAFLTVPSRYVYLFGAFFTVIARMAFLNVFDYVGMAIITAVMGFLRTWIHVTLPLVFGEHLPKERFPSGYGLFMFLQGNIMFAVGPVVGYIRDATHSYIITFHCLNFFMAACAVPWIIEIIILKLKKKANVNNNQVVLHNETDL